MGIDAMSISGHKIYGPKGVGAAYVRRRPRVRLEPLIHGGGQERGLRSGTVAAPIVVGLGEAARLAKLEMAADHAHVSALSKRLIDGIAAQVESVVRNGDPEQGYPGCVNLSFAYVEGESLLMALKDIALSSGSACTSASLEPSYVLRALGASDDMAHSSLRFGIGRFTTEAEVDFVVKRIVQVVGKLRDMSPLWVSKQIHARVRIELTLGTGDGPGWHQARGHRVVGPLSARRSEGSKEVERKNIHKTTIKQQKTAEEKKTHQHYQRLATSIGLAVVIRDR
jgi:hypothetical protein